MEDSDDGIQAVEEFLDNIGLPDMSSYPPLSAGDIYFDPKTWNLKFQEEKPGDNKRRELDNKKWLNKTLFRPGSLLKTKTGFPLCFSGDGPSKPLWKDSTDFGERSFYIMGGVTLILVEEGIVNTGKITPEQGYKKGFSCGYITHDEYSFQQLRYIKCLAELTESQAAYAGKQPGPHIFYILFDRNIGKIYAEELLFEVLFESNSPYPKLQTTHYRLVGLNLHSDLI